MKAIAPGKLILSGEHAVVYGRPALAMAIDLCAESVITGNTGEGVSFDLVNYDLRRSYTLRALRAFRDRLMKNYRQFLNGDLTIRDVLYKPVDLFQFAFIIALDGLHLKLTHGLNIQCVSAIPIGCGLGSSAATILSTLRAVGHYFRVEFKPEWYMEYSLEAEKLQHGYPSGIDSYVSLYGGCSRFQAGKARAVPLPRYSMHLVQTGEPASTTGECVEHIRQTHGDAPIWNDFEDVTDGLESAIVSDDRERLREAVNENDRLLREVGVVPDRVQAFIDDVRRAGGAAKICGAGAVRGDAAGTVLVCGEPPPVDLCEKYGYRAMTVRGDPLGTRIV